MSRSLPITKARFGVHTLIAFGFLLIAMLGLVPTADAVQPGRNGRIVFTSGREAADDSNARLYLREAFGNSGFGELSDPITPLGGQSRHPSWSPDRTKIVFANGSLAQNEYDLFVKDLVTGSLTPLDGTQLADGKSSDHPTWSPDGTRIAYEHQTTAGNPNREIMVKTVGTSAPAVPLTNSAEMELKPAWSPDSQTLYYAKNGGNFNIVKQPAAGGAETPVLNSATADEYQPAISPDGSKMCYTHQSTVGNTTTAEITTVDLPAGNNPVNISDDATKGDINCVFSPDGRKIAFTNGVFGQGRLVMANADDSSPFPTELAQDQGGNNFDGNADWAPDASPECPDTTATTQQDTPVTINLECLDGGPEYERTDPNGFVANDGGPKNGTATDSQPTANPSTVKYTPNPGFTGTDTIEYTSFDKAGFGTDKGTVTITVTAKPKPEDPKTDPKTDPQPKKPKCGGLQATIVGTPGNDTLVGTRGRDVIVAGAGNDKVRAAGGNDVVCGGAGNDRLNGGAGKDRLNGGAGRDRISGGAGKDRLFGGAARDRVVGGAARDKCRGGAGRDSVSCENAR